MDDVGEDTEVTREAAPGRVLGGRYELGPLLGTGGMASVFEGTDRVLERRVAVKVLHPQIARDPSYVERFRREATIAATLSHPGVVWVFDTGEDQGVRFIVMEHVEGHTLAAEIAREGALAPERTAAIGAAVCDALAAAHARGLVHRDVKPGNIMLDAGGRVKVMDFGIARADSADTLTKTAMVMGTAAYLSPEQARGERADARSDLYSLGCVLHAMLTGEPPFSGDSAVAVAGRHLNEDPLPPSRSRRGVPPALDAVVLRALAKDPADRFPDARAMRAALVEAAGDASPTGEATVPPTLPLPAAGRPTPAHRPDLRRAMRVAAVVGLLLGLVALGYALTSGGEERPGRVTAPPDRPPASIEPEPTTEPSPTPTAPPAETALAGLDQLLAAAVASGQIEEKAADRVGDHAHKGFERSQEGDPDKAIDEVEKAAQELSKASEKGEVNADAAAVIGAALARLIEAVSAA